MVSLHEAAPYLGRSYEWLLNQCHRGAVPHHKVGRNYFMTPSDVRAAQESFAVSVTPERRDPHGLRPRSRAHLNAGGRRRR